MSDRHLRILTAAARRGRRQLDAHRAGPVLDPADPATARSELEQTTARTLAQVVAAQARRRRANSHGGGSSRPTSTG
jgi:hypothetical protein